MENISRFIKENELTVTSEKLMDYPEYEWFNGTHYVVTISDRNKKYVTYHSKNLGDDDKKPTIEEVISEFKLNFNYEDIGIYLEDITIEDYAMQYGYDVDNSYLGKVYDNFVNRRKDLIDFLGREQFEEMLNI